MTRSARLVVKPQVQEYLDEARAYECEECGSKRFIKKDVMTCLALSMVDLGSIRGNRHASTDGTPEHDGGFYDSEGWRCINGHYQEGDGTEYLDELISEGSRPQTMTEADRKVWNL